MVFLSRVRIDTTLRSSRLALADPNRMHAMVAGCFDNTTEKQRPLWRVDTLSGNTYLLMVSSETPELSMLLPQLTAEGGDDAAIKDYAGFLSSLSNGDVYRFRLSANPVHSAKIASGRGKVFGQVTVEQQKAWLENRALKNGFALQTFDLVSRGVRKFKRQNAIVTLSVATFEGLLVVRDVDLLRDALSLGIGRAKAYGCGLMTVAKP